MPTHPFVSPRMRWCRNAGLLFVTALLCVRAGHATWRTLFPRREGVCWSRQEGRTRRAAQEGGRGFINAMRSDFGDTQAS
jgi:hypothetical protein